ncbi:MAG: MaoC domain protein dehydratase [Nocardioides sp.]|nr:MaoC domain protein dehydratase [Nocardioides sp.]
MPGEVYAEDLEVGVRLDAGSYVMTEPEIVAFAEAWDPQAFHVDPRAAAAGHFGGLIASGIHTIAVFQRLAVHAHFRRWQVVAGRGIADVRFLVPVRPGDVLSCSFVVEGVAIGVRGRAEVAMRARVENQTGTRVLGFTMASVVRTRADAVHVRGASSSASRA